MTTPRPREGLDSRDVDGEVVVWDGASLHLLDAAASALWHLADGSRTLSQIVDALVVSHIADRDALAADVTELVGSLVARGLLEPARSAGYRR